MTPEILALIGIALTALGGVLGAWLHARSQRRTAEVAAKSAALAAQKTSEQSLIDQLQEELTRYREQTDKRLERLEAENQAYRDFIFVQRDHMKAHGVVPPPWPTNLPR